MCAVVVCTCLWHPDNRKCLEISTECVSVCNRRKICRRNEQNYFFFGRTFVPVFIRNLTLHPLKSDTHLTEMHRFEIKHAAHAPLDE